MAEYFTLTYKEIGPVATVDTVKTDRLVIIGTALDGPTNVPIKVRTQADAERIFGPLNYNAPYINPQNDSYDGAYAYNELVRAFLEANRAGAEDIYLVRVGGTKATACEDLGGSAGLTFKALNAGRLYNEVDVAMTRYPATGTPVSGALTITAPASIGGTISYTYDNTVTLMQLVNRINSDERNKALAFSLLTASDPYALAASLSGSTTTSGGTYGTTAPSEDYASDKFGLYTKLTEEDGTYDTLVDFNAELFLQSTLYLDDQVVTGGAATTTSIGTKFAEFISNVNRNHPCHGFIGLRPLGFDNTDPEKVALHIKNNWESTSAGYVSTNLKWLKAGYFVNTGFTGTNSEGETVDYGSLITVVAGPDIRMALPALGTYQTNPVSLYAGFVSSLDSQRATTKKTLNGTLGLAFALKEKQLTRVVNGVGFDSANRINGKGAMVLFRRNADNLLPEVAYDVTFANDRSKAYADLQPQRVVGEAIRLIKKELEPFLGEAFTTPARLAMETRVKRVLERMVETGKLHASGEGSAFRFDITANPYQIANNEVSVDLELWPALQVKRIRISTTVRRG